MVPLEIFAAEGRLRHFLPPTFSLMVRALKVANIKAWNIDAFFLPSFSLSAFARITRAHLFGGTSQFLYFFFTMP